jgi:6-pyruvoyltetrahydropterin/6-carboxytetrahydropterin synthase
MRTTITCVMTFAAAHFLPDHQGKCKNLHGHTYTLEVSVSGVPGRNGPSAGMVMDFADLREKVANIVIAPLDHTVLNEAVDFVPTVEAIAGWIFGRLEAAGLPVVRVRLYEGANSYAEVTA